MRYADIERMCGQGYDVDAADHAHDHALDHADRHADRDLRPPPLPRLDELTGPAGADTMTAESTGAMAEQPAVHETEASPNGASPETVFPVDSFRDAAPHLRRPFTAEAIHFKVQSQFGAADTPTGGLIVAYIDARLVIERLNLVVPHLWHDRYEQLDGNLMVCHLTVDGITRPDVGEGTGKALRSDALKRAAVKFGVGVSVYALPQIKLNVGDGAKDLKVIGRQKKRLLIPDGTMGKLRDGYSKWLETRGIHAFGEPLDHGDVADHQGDIDDPDGPAAHVDAETGEVTGRELPAHSTSREAKKLDVDNERLIGELAYTPAKRTATLDGARTLGQKKALHSRLSGELDRKLDSEAAG